MGVPNKGATRDIGRTRAPGRKNDWNCKHDFTVLIRLSKDEPSCRFLIDTGAEVSIIKESSLPINHRNYRVNSRETISLTGVTPGSVRTKGTTMLRVAKKWYKFHVVGFDFKLKQDGILGKNTLRDSVVNCREQTLHLNDEVYHFGAEATQVIKLRPRTETLVLVEVDKCLGNGILEKQELAPGVRIPESLTRADQYRAIVSIINTTEEEIQMTSPRFHLEDPIPETEMYVESVNEEQANCFVMGSEQSREKKVTESIRTEHMVPKDREEILKICAQFSDIFYLEGDKLSCTDVLKHTIQLKEDTAPINLRPYRLPEAQKEEVQKQIDKMLEEQIIEPSISPWSAPIILIPKKIDSSGKKKFRLVVDFRKLNEVTIGDAHPLPNITDILDQLGKAKYFSTLDLASGYYQVQLDEKDREKTAFSALNKHYQFKRMAMGLKNSPATFMRLMQAVLSGLNGLKCQVYLDDIVVYGESFEIHNQRLKEIFQRLREYNLKIHPDKCEFLRAETNFLGHIISDKGIEPDPKKIQAVRDFPQPKTTKELKSFLGLSGYYRRFIANYSKIGKPLYGLLKKGVKYEWGYEQEKAFQELKERLVSAPILQYPDFTQPFNLTTDASDYAIGCILSQGPIGKDLPVAYGSRTLNKAERNYSTIEKELLAIVWACKHFRPYLYGRRFIIMTDHKPLKWIFSVQDPSSRLLRWRLKLEEYDYEIQYKKGRLNTNADCLSRLQPEGETNGEVKVTSKDESENPCTENDKESETEEVENKETKIKDDVEEQEIEAKNSLTKEEKTKIIEEHHLSLIGGHQGIQRTYHKLKGYITWPGMKKDVEEYIRKCKSCQLNKRTKPETRMRMQITDTPDMVLEKIAMDIVGPYPVTEDGNRYILTIQDQLSRYLVTCPMKNQEAETVAQALVDKVILVYGIPSIILTDRGANFMSETMRKVCRLLRISQLNTSAYRPQSNGAVERSHAVLTEYLRHYVCTKQTDWDKYLQSATFVYNTTPSSGTGYTPFELMFARKANLPGNLQKKPVEMNYSETDDYLERFKRTLQENCEIARRNLIQSKERSKQDYDKKVREETFKVGDKVLVHDETVRRGRSKKLSSQWIGPYTVIGIQGVNCILQRTRNKTMRVHMNRLKLFL